MKTDIGSKFKTGLLLWIASSAATFLYLGHMTGDPWKIAVAEAVGSPAGSFRFFLSQFAFASFLLFVSSMVGVFLSERYNLPGVGDIGSVLERKRYALPIVLGGALLGYVMHDSVFIDGTANKGWPEMLPTGLVWSAAFVVFSALNKEVFFRFGMLTLFAGLFRGRRNVWAVAASSFFAASLSMKELVFSGHTLGLDTSTISVYAWALGLNLFLGWIYMRKGLWVAMAARICVDSRFIIHAVLLLLWPDSGAM